MKTINYLSYLALIPVFSAIAAFIFKKYFNPDHLFFKNGVALSCAIICLFIVLFVQPDEGNLWLLILAFILSPAGDWYIRNRSNDKHFILGIIFFWLAHLGFFLYALSKAAFSRGLFIIILVPFLLLHILVFLPSERLKGNRQLSFITLMYVLISCLSLTAAFNLNSLAPAYWLFPAGIASLVISDLIIALGTFLNVNKRVNLYLALYYLSHILILLSVLLAIE